jgi:hypothetical protein
VKWRCAVLLLIGAELCLMLSACPNPAGSGSVPVSGVTLNASSTILSVGDTYSLVATVAPANATNQTVTWSSTDPLIASVDSSGIVTAIAAGSASVKATTTDGGKTAACALTIYLAVPRYRLVGEWLLNGSLDDTSGSGNTLAVAGTSPAAANDRFNTANHAYAFNGISDGFSTVPTSYGLINGYFTISIWAKPETTITIDTEASVGMSGTSGQRYLVGPVQSFGAYGDSCACAGISCGTNGVSVYEHTDGYLPAVLVWEGTVSGWTHIVVVYYGMQPSLYINGAFEKSGLASSYSVHPSALIGYCSSYGYFQGDADDMRVYNRALSDAEILGLYHENRWAGQ